MPYALSLEAVAKLPFKVDPRVRPTLETIKVGMTFIHDNKRYKCNAISESRAICLPMWTTKVTLTDKKGKQRTFYRSTNTALNLSPNATVIRYLEPRD